MRRDQAETAESIQKKITLVALAETPGFIMVGLGVYAKFVANDEAFHPLLNDPNIVNVMLGIGISIMIVCAISIMKLSLKRKKLLNNSNSAKRK